MLRKAAHTLVLIALVVGVSLPMAVADRQQQARIRRLNACVGLIPTPADPDARTVSDPWPYLFYVLDQRKDLKPDGWEFQCPGAPAFVTLEQQVRWNNPQVQQGLALKPDMGAYWEVPISEANFSRLEQMDVIYIPIT